MGDTTLVMVSISTIMAPISADAVGVETGASVETVGCYCILLCSSRRPLCRTDLRFSPFAAFSGSISYGSQSPALSIMTRVMQLLCGSDALQVTASDSEPTETYVPRLQ
jgi:hypothetical protein